MHLSLLQDVSDFEWVMWFSTFCNHVLFALTGHVIFAKIFTLLAPKVRVCFGLNEVLWIFFKTSCRCNCMSLLSVDTLLYVCIVHVYMWVCSCEWTQALLQSRPSIRFYWVCGVPFKATTQWCDQWALGHMRNWIQWNSIECYSILYLTQTFT